MGLADLLVSQDEVRGAAHKLATEIAQSGPLAVQAIRATLRKGLADSVIEATKNELAVQSRLRTTKDFKEGIKSMAERRVPRFKGE